MQKIDLSKIAVIFWLLSLVSFKAFSGTLFDIRGQVIPTFIGSGFTFPQDLEKTNLKIVQADMNNPFEWAGRIQYHSGQYLSPCTGGVVALPGYRPQDRALVITAGHCIKENNGLLGPHEVLSDYALTRKQMFFDFPRARQLNDAKKSESKKYYFRRIVFSSFDVIDLAIVEMEQTYEQLNYGMQKPPMLTRRAFKNGETVSAYGLPAEQYVSYENHLSICQTNGLYTDKMAYLNAGDELYHLTRRVLMNCSIFGGMSGGYVRDHLGQVIGVISGGMDDGPSFYAGTAPLMICARKDGRFDDGCLAKLKDGIQKWKGKTRSSQN